MTDDALWQAVHDARPAPPADDDSAFSPSAQALLQSILAADPADRRVRMRTRARWRPTAGFVLPAVSVAVALAVVLVVVFAGGKSSPSAPSHPAAHGGGGAGGGGGGGALRGPAQSVAPHSRVLPGSAKLIVTAADPQGGLPWGLREIRTNRGQVCVEVGRVKNSQIGMLGVDGAWGNDGRFHLLPVTGDEVSLETYCGDTDANGNAFLNGAQDMVLPSASGGVSHNGSAHGAAARVLLCQGSTRAGRYTQDLATPCPAGVRLVDLTYGLIGPDAASITYIGASGHRITEPARGPDGAYLIVEPYTPCDQGRGHGRGACPSLGYYGPQVQPGVITAVRYRSGRVCHLPVPEANGFVHQTRPASCPLVGYRPPSTPHVTPADVASPVAVTVNPAASYCASNAPNPPGCKVTYLHIAFTAHVAVHSLNSYYEAVIDMPPRDYKPGAAHGCPGALGSVGPTTSVIRAGQRFVWNYEAGEYPKDCAGNVIHVTVAYVADARLGLNGVGSELMPSPGRGAITVGRASVTVPGA